MIAYLKANAMKMYYIGLFSLFALGAARPAHAAPTGTCAVENASWLTVLGNLIHDPVKWAMYVTGATTILFILIFGLKIRGAQGRQDKLERAYDFGKYFLGGSIIIFGASALGQWFLGKFGCTI